MGKRDNNTTKPSESDGNRGRETNQTLSDYPRRQEEGEIIYVSMNYQTIRKRGRHTCRSCATILRTGVRERERETDQVLSDYQGDRNRERLCMYILSDY